MVYSKSKPPTLEHVLKKTSDAKTIALFNSIAISAGDSSVLLRKCTLTAKEFYGRISGLIDAGLIKRYKGKYSLTLFGKVVYDSQMIIGKALSYYSKLKVIESIEVSYGATLPKEELARLIDALIDNYQIKGMIMRPTSVGPTKKNTKMYLVRKK